MVDSSFLWSDKAEPHSQRKQELLVKYGPQIRKLMGPEPLTKYIIAVVVAVHLYLATIAPTLSWPAYLLLAYVVGGTLTHVCFLGIHEVTHNLAFKEPWKNDLLAMLCNFPIPIPYAMSFKVLHHEHHRYQGWDGVDTDVPTEWETQLFKYKFGKFLFLAFQVVFYAVRPTFVRGVKWTPMLLLNFAIQIPVDLLLWYNFGFGVIMYLFLCLFTATSLTPLAGHFISEHFVFDPNSTQETYSYYGPLNALTWNVGYHNEHHDFPNVPWSRLKELKRVAPEYYECFMETKSWPGTLYNFIMDDKMTLGRRMKREKGAGERSNLLPTTK